MTENSTIPRDEDWYLLLGDETNTQPSERVKFLMYGGLIVPLRALVSLCSCVRRERDKLGYAQKDTLKFQTRARPEKVPHKDVTAAKKTVIQHCITSGCSLIAQIAHHGIVNVTEKPNRTTFGMNEVLARFDDYLEEREGYGLVLLDRATYVSEKEFTREKQRTGLIYPSSDFRRPLENQFLYGMTYIEGSSACEAADIALGTLRYCINHAAEERCSEMFHTMLDLLWYQESCRTRTYHDRGLIWRPRPPILVQKYRRDYEELKDQLSVLASGYDAAGRRLILA